MIPLSLLLPISEACVPDDDPQVFRPSVRVLDPASALSLSSLPGGCGGACVTVRHRLRSDAASQSRVRACSTLGKKEGVAMRRVELKFAVGRSDGKEKQLV